MWANSGYVSLETDASTAAFGKGLIVSILLCIDNDSKNKVHVFLCVFYFFVSTVLGVSNVGGAFLSFIFKKKKKTLR